VNRRLLVAVLVLIPLVAGCATKRDLRDLQSEVDRMRQENAAVMRQIQEQNRQILDSLVTQNTRMRGDVANRFTDVDRQLVQIQELTGQSQRRLNEMREQITRREEGGVPTGAGAASGTAPAGNPEEMYNAALAALRRGSHATARAGFEEVLRHFPQHPLASEAQFHIGESFQEAREPVRALEAYGRVLSAYPNAPKAPTALYRAGQIELERGNREQARTFFNQVVTAYPRSVEAPLARDQLQRLGRR
jgi:tol-pal system protein YbgF